MKLVTLGVDLLTQRVIERLLTYKKVLEKLKGSEQKGIFSKELAMLSGNSPAQVRRDIMFVGYNGNPNNGYDITTLLQGIDNLLENDEVIQMVLVGVGNLGRALLGYFMTQQTKYRIIAAFDTNTDLVDRVIGGTRCYHIDTISEICEGKDIQLGLVSVPGGYAQATTNKLINQGNVKGIVNFTTEPVNVPESVYLENIQITMSIDKAAYFSRKKGLDNL